MVGRQTAAIPLLRSIGVLAVLAGCATNPFGPTVQVMPGPGKSFASFQADNEACKNFASEQVKGQAEASNQRTAGTAVLGTLLGASLGAATGSAFGSAGQGAGIGAATGVASGAAIGAAGSANDQAAIQQQYDNAFSQCMYAQGDQVPGYAPVMAIAPVGPRAAAPVADPLVRSTQLELIRLGYLGGGADGFMGPKTRNAIANYQSSRGLSASGEPSPSLLAQLHATPGEAPAAVAAAPAPRSNNWVSPTNAAPAAAAASPTASAAGWVTPTRSP